MATETASAPLNGNYTQHQGQGYGVAEHNYNAHGMNSAASAPYTATPAAASTQAASGNGSNDIPKDEVGWYFVEQYYTTLSRSPEKLYLFYNKRSQFVSGVEEEKVSVCIGQKAINDRIKEQDFQDCKVRVTNVDSQGSDQNIVIQVIGEISNKHAPHRKFVQTFVLAEQTNGYFVLNDIFRYIQEEELEVADEPQQEQTDVPSGYIEPVHSTAEPEAKPAETTNTDQTVQDEEAAAKVDKELEAVVEPKAETSETPAGEVNGASTTETTEATTQKDEPPAIPVAVPEKISKPEVTATPPAEEAAQPEQPKEPEPTRAATPKASPAPPAVPAAPPKPAAPKTWASLAASANKVATPNVVVPSPTSIAPPQSKPAAQPQQPAAAPAATPATPATPTPAREPSPTNSQGDAGSGWQTAGADHNKRQSRIQPQAVPENTSTRAYIKNVYESVDGDALKSTLAKYGEIAYFDISRQKNCAFVDFATLAGFQAAVAANPHRIGDDVINVEERRLRPGQYQYVPRGGVRGGRGRAEGGQPGQGRGGYKQDGGRGTFGRGRGTFTPRGRGTS